MCDYHSVITFDPSINHIIHSFIHSYSFNVQVDITQLQSNKAVIKTAADHIQ